VATDLDGGRVRLFAKSFRMRRRRSRSVLFRRWAAVGALVIVALLYYRPLKAYVDARGELGQRHAVVQRLELEKSQLQHRLAASTSVATLAREARALGYVRPGERLYIVRGIPEWRKRLRASMMAPRGR
jgi:cell division protein FtsB